MNQDSHKSLVNNKSFSEVLQKGPENSVGSGQRYPEDDQQHSPRSTYESFFWFYNYTRNFATRLANDILMSILRYWFPNQVPPPYHLVDLLRAYNRLRAERELHTVTYSSSREQRSLRSSEISMREFFNAFKSYVLSSEDGCGLQNSKSFECNETDPEPMLVIVDSRCVSDPSSKEILIETKCNKEIGLKFFFSKNFHPVGIPSTSTENKNDIIPPQMKLSESTDELQMVDINLQNENDIAITDSEPDTDSIVFSYQRNKDTLIGMEGTLVSTKKKSSLLESLPKMETIPESEQCPSFPMTSKIDIVPNCYIDDE